jgi:hypothetical protein
MMRNFLLDYSTQGIQTVITMAIAALEHVDHHCRGYIALETPDSRGRTKVPKKKNNAYFCSSFFFFF